VSSSSFRGKLSLSFFSFTWIAKDSTPRSVASPRATIAFPVSDPMPGIVLRDAIVGVGMAVEAEVSDAKDINDGWRIADRLLLSEGLGIGAMGGRAVDVVVTS